MHFLMTGMTAQQANPDSHRRSANYAGFLREVLVAGGHEVDWDDPSIDHDLAKYDYVIVGVAPITSLGANRTYGALSIIDRLWDSEKLTLLLDAPEPLKIDRSLQAIVDKPGNLTKNFFSYRKEYDLAGQPEHRDRLLQVVERLNEEDWPRTLVPALPWHTPELMAPRLPRGVRDAVFHLGDLEVFALEAFETDTVATLNTQTWAYEDGSDRKWIERQAIEWPYSQIPWSSRKEADDQAINMLRHCSGTLIAPERTGTWWNTRYGMSVAQGVPVFTEWQEAATIGHGWSTLPMVYESVDYESQVMVAIQQVKQYVQAINTRDQAIGDFEKILT